MVCNRRICVWRGHDTSTRFEMIRSTDYVLGWGVLLRSIFLSCSFDLWVGSHMVSSPESYSCQQVPTWRQSLDFWASKAHEKHGLVTLCLLYANQNSWDLCRELGATLNATPTLNTTRVPSLASTKWCHIDIQGIIGDLGLGIMCEAA